MPGSTNFLQWNPTSANQENDAAYLADSLRSGGAPVDALLPSATFNKLVYQVSTCVTALMQMMANKGFTVADANLGTLTSVLANFITTADIIPEYLAVAFSPTLILDCSKSKGFEVTLTGNVTTLSFINRTLGQPIKVSFVQGGGGGFTVAWPADVVSHGTVNGTAGNRSIQAFWALSDSKLHPLAPMTVS